MLLILPFPGEKQMQFQQVVKPGASIGEPNCFISFVIIFSNS
jgi:hypothetical protein